METVVKDGSEMSEGYGGHQQITGDRREDPQTGMKRARLDGGLTTEAKCLTTKGRACRQDGTP